MSSQESKCKGCISYQQEVGFLYGHHEHAALMEAHKKREKYGEYNEFARRCGTLTKKVVRGLTQSEEEHTYSSVPEPPKPK